MANIIRSPFYVPKPADNQREWFRQSVEWSNSWLIQLLTNTKLYGAPGQVPTKRWRYDYNTGESVWNQGPLSSWPIRLLTNTKQYGQGGQVKAKLWRWDYDLNSDTTQWNWKNPPNKVLVAVPSPFRTGPWLYEFNDASGWQWQAPRNRILDVSFVSPFVSQAWHYDLNVEQYWQWQAPYNVALTSTYAALGPLNERNVQPLDEAFWGWRVPANLQLYGPVTLNPFKSGLWLDLLYEPPVWTGAPLVSGIIGQLKYRPTTPTKQWRYDYDSAAEWIGKPQRSALLAPLLTAAGQPRTKTWRYDYDSAASWQPFSVRNRNLLDTAASPFVPGFSWTFYTADSANWQWQAQPNGLLLVATPTETTPNPVPIQSAAGVWRPGYNPERKRKRKKRRPEEIELAELAEAIAAELPYLPEPEAEQYQGVVDLARLAPVDVSAVLADARAALAAIRKIRDDEEEYEAIAMLMLGL